MKTDEKTLKLIAEVKKRKDEIADVQRAQYVTNMSFSFGQGGKPINLHVVNDVQQLITIVSFLLREDSGYRAAVGLLGLPFADAFPEFEWDGFTVDEWVRDIRTRITKIQLKERQKQLAELEKRLDKIVSPELRAKMELEAIEQELNL